MAIEYIYKDAVPVGISANSLLMTGATLPDDVQGPPPPQIPLIHHFGHAGLCRAEIQHIDEFRPSSYQFQSIGPCRAHNPMGCQLTGSTETLCPLNCRKFRNFTLDDWCNLLDDVQGPPQPPQDTP